MYLPRGCFYRTIITLLLKFRMVIYNIADSLRPAHKRLSGYLVIAEAILYSLQQLSLSR